MYDLVYKVAEAEGAVAKLTEQLALSEARVVKLEGLIEEQRRTLEDFKDQMSILVSKLLVRATLPSALNMMSASSVGKLVQLVTASRLTCQGCKACLLFRAPED